MILIIRDLFTVKVKPAKLMRTIVPKGLKCVFVILLIAAPFFSTAQTQQLHFTHISTEDGLSEITPLCIMQDSKGFIWIGTEDGLNRYDGYKFKIFRNDPKDTTTIASNYIQDIKEDKRGNIWIATANGGLDKFDRKTNIFRHYIHNAK